MMDTKWIQIVSRNDRQSPNEFKLCREMTPDELEMHYYNLPILEQ